MGKHNPPITEAFKQMREEFGDIFADIKDVDAYCREVRYGDMSKATPDFDTSPQHVEQTDTLQGAAPCRHCGGSGTTPADDGHGLRSCVCCKGTGEQPNFTNQPASAPMPEEAEQLLILLESVKGDTILSVPASVLENISIDYLRRAITAANAKPSPAPMPEEVEELLLRAQEGPYPGDAADAIRTHISDLTRRLAEVEADSKDAYANYAKSGREYYARLRRAEAAEAKLQRIMEWARGRCGACENEGSEGDTCYNCQTDNEQSNWTPPISWGENR